jgi:hypothetical protein
LPALLLLAAPTTPTPFSDFATYTPCSLLNHFGRHQSGLATSAARIPNAVSKTVRDSGDARQDNRSITGVGIAGVSGADSSRIRRPPQAISAERDSVTPIHNDGALWRNNGTSPQFGDSSLYVGATQHRGSLNNSAFQISRAPYDRDSEGTEGAASAAGVVGANHRRMSHVCRVEPPIAICDR